jgi:hypothetical protein
MSRRTKITTLMMGEAAVYPMEKPDAVGCLNNLSAGCGGMHYIVWGDGGGEQYLFDR